MPKQKDAVDAVIEKKKRAPRKKKADVETAPIDALPVIEADYEDVNLDEAATQHLNSIQNELPFTSAQTAVIEVPSNEDAAAPEPAPQANAEQMVRDYLALRAAKSDITARAKAQTDQIDSAMATIENEFLALSKATGVSTFGVAGVGTVYLAPSTYVKVADKSTWVKWLADSYNTANSLPPEQAQTVRDIVTNLLTSSASKQAVLDFAKAQNFVPPGLDITQVIEVHVRKK